jgi:MYXO-CTERM domain-containing protein
MSTGGSTSYSGAGIGAAFVGGPKEGVDADENGCACRAVVPSSAPGGRALLTLALAGFAWARRRRA